VRERLALVMLVALALAPRPASAGEPCATGGGPQAIAELAGPPFTFPTGIAAAADGAIWVASTYADQLVRVDPVALRTTVVALPLHSHPVGLAADAQGRIWFAGSGVGLVGRLAPGAARTAEFPPPSLLRAAGAIPTVSAIALAPEGEIAWFTVGPHSTVAWLPADAEPLRRGSVVTEVALGPGLGRPEGIAVDRAGAAWVTEMAADTLVHVGRDGTVGRLPLPAGSRPRGVAVAPDGHVWVALFGRHELLEVTPATGATQSWPMPSGTRSHPWALAVDEAGGVWTSEFTANTVTCFDRGRVRFAVWAVPTRGSGVRALTVDRRGRAWFVGSGSGRLGVVGPPLPRDTMSAR
jgi:virginiamycin B lyase